MMQSRLLPPATKLGQGNIFRSVCQEFCSQGGGLARGSPGPHPGGRLGVWLGGSPGPHPGGGGVWLGGSPGPHPGGRLGGLARGSPEGRLGGLARGSPGAEGRLGGLARGVSRPTPRGEVGGSGQGGLQAHTWGDLQAQAQGGSQHALRQTHSIPCTRLLLRGVCILVIKTLMRIYVSSFYLSVEYLLQMGEIWQDWQDAIPININK